MGRHKGFTSEQRGRASEFARNPPAARSRLLLELLAIMDADARGIKSTVGIKVNHVTISRWRNGKTNAANLRSVELAGEAYGYRLQWVKDKEQET